MTQTPDVRLAIMETEATQMKADLHELKADVRIIRDAITEAKGGWKLMMIVGGVGASVGAFISQFIPLFHKA